MIENLVITKTGSEADNPQRTVFSSTTEWESTGANLIVNSRHVNSRHFQNDATHWD